MLFENILFFIFRNKNQKNNFLTFCFKNGKLLSKIIA